MASSIITTDKAKCRDCYRCVRVCPVKAIRVSEGQAKVDGDKCIICGTCVRECPQKAKHVRDDIEKVRELISKKSDSSPIIASVAPSFPAAISEFGNGLLQASLKQFGFDLVTETSVGAELVAQATADLLKKDQSTWVTSACPVVVNMVEMYYPQYCENITPFVSPMIAHGIYLKQKYGKNAKVVFIGPCSAKKCEADEDKNKAVDAVLTFEELRDALEQAGINHTNLQPIAFDDVRPANAQLFPLDGGLAKTASIKSGLFSEDFAAVSGVDHVAEMIDNLSSTTPIKLFEALFCASGCINGACIGKTNDIFSRKSKVLQYHKRKTFEAEKELNADEVDINLFKEIKKVDMPKQEFTEKQIRAVLMETGKKSVEDELNCGACGYGSCRENALAVLSGMAEKSMCLPWMRHIAERKTDQIIDNSPNGIVVVNSDFNIVSFNHAFANMFTATDILIGKPISILIDPEDFEKVAAGVIDMINSKTISFPQYNIIASESIYKLEDENLLIGIFANITQTKEDEDRIARMRSETLANAEQVIERQMRMAQEIAGILGETTSETRVLLRKLTNLARDVEKPQDK